MKKTNLIVIGLILVMFAFLTACPYSSTVPLTQPTVKLDPNLFGQWNYQTEYDDNPQYFIFSDIDGMKFKAEKYEYDTESEIYTVSGTYVCHLTDIGTTRFANMSQDGSYSFYKIELKGGELKLFEVTDNIDETFSTSAELFAFFKLYKDLSFFYNKDEETYLKSN